MDISFCINNLALPGLGPTISSLVRNCSAPSQINFFFLCANLRQEDKNNITQLLSREGFSGTYQYIDFAPLQEFGHLNSLHGDWTAYGRLLLAELLQIDRVLYLDADLIIETDILEIDSFDLQNNALAAVAGNTLQYALDHPFLNGVLGIPMNTSCFNSGVLYLDLKAWREENIKEECMSLAAKHPSQLISHDQTLLNAVFYNRFTRLDNLYNTPWHADNARKHTGEKIILHYQGSPKPWDTFGEVLREGYQVWKKYLDKSWAKQYSGFTLRKLHRTWHIRKSYARVIYSSLKS